MSLNVSIAQINPIVGSFKHNTHLILDAISQAKEEHADSEKISSLMEKIGTASADEKDDLKLISGVGPKLEGVLNGIGIFTFVQVSKMTKSEYDLMDSITKSFPGRAERDNWAAQAKELMNKKN